MVIFHYRYFKLLCLGMCIVLFATCVKLPTDRNSCPDPPRLTVVPSTYSPTVPYIILVTGTDSDGDALAYQFEIHHLTQGTDLTEWTNYFPSGKEIGYLFYADKGSYIIRARSRDAMNKMSDFSRELSLQGPPDLQLIGSCHIGGGAKKVVVVGNYAYISTSENGLRVADVSNPTTPLVIGGSGSFSSSGIGYNGEAVFLLTTGALYSYDISSPNTPFQLDQYPIGGSTLCLDVKGDFALIGYGGLEYGGWWRAVVLIDVSKPDTLKKVAIYGADWYGSNVALGYPYVYESSYSDAVNVVDFSNPQNPHVIANIYPFSGEYKSSPVWIFVDPMGSLYVATISYSMESYLNVINVQDPNNPQLLSVATIHGISIDIHSSGSYLAIAYGSSGLDLFNVSDPVHPFLIGQYDTPGSCEGVWCGSDYLYAADSSSGLLIFSYPAVSSHSVRAQKRNTGVANGPIFDNGALRIFPLLPQEDSTRSLPE